MQDVHKVPPLKAAEPKVLKEPFQGVTTDLLATQQRLFLAV
jgi:hypothetical protein